MFARWRRSQGPTDEATPEVPASASRAVEVRGDRLPSRDPSVFFTVRIDGVWRPCENELSQDVNLAVLARHQLREQVRRTLVFYTVLDAAAAQDAVNADITGWHSAEPGLEIRGSVRLTVEAQDKALAEEHLRQDRARSLDQQETLGRLTFLQRVMSDPDLRLVWWIDRHPDRINELRDVKTTLQDLKPPHDPSHDVLRDEVVRFVDQLLADIRTPQQREVFLRALAQTLHVLGRTELQAAAAQWLDAAAPDSGSASA